MITQAQASELDRLACAALDAVEQLNRAAVDAASTHPDANLDRLRAQRDRAAVRRDRTERELFDAIHALVERPEAPAAVERVAASNRRWRVWLTTRP